MLQIQLKMVIKIILFCILTAVIGTIYYNKDIIIEVTDIDIVLPYVSEFKESYVQFHRQLLSMLLEAEEHIANENYLKAILKIRTVIALLDNRYHKSLLINTVLKPKIKTGGLNENTIYIEDNISFKVDPFETFVSRPKINLTKFQIPLSIVDFSEFVTVLIDDCEVGSEKLRVDKNQQIISQIRKQLISGKVIFATNYSNVEKLEPFLRFKDVKVIGVSCDNWNRAPMKSLLSYISTPYVLVLTSVSAVTTDFNISRLLRVADGVQGVGLVGMAERGSDGAWDYTCFQLNLHYSHLTIFDGYEYSKEACLLCDVTSNSFLAATSLFQDALQDSDLPLSSRQIDWAIKLQKLNIATLTCPDVMIHVNTKIIYHKIHDTEYLSLTEQHEENLELKQLYIKLAQKLQLYSITFPNGSYVEYSCSEIKYNCNLSSHQCCIKEKEIEMKRFSTFSNSFLIPFRIEKRSLLDAVKYKVIAHMNNKVNLFYQISDVNPKRYEILKTYKFFRSLQSDVDKLNKTNSIRIQESEFQLDLRQVEELSNFVVNSSFKLSRNLPCFLFGHYAISIYDFLNNLSDIKQSIVKKWKGQIKKLNETRHISVEIPENLLVKSFEDARCYLYSFVRIGEIWIPAPFNPGSHVLKMFGSRLYKK